MALHFIAFSKDRAFQLQELLRSLEAHTDCSGLSGLGGGAAGDDERRISVLWTASADGDRLCTAESYEAVMAAFPAVRFVREEVCDSYCFTCAIPHLAHYPLTKCHRLPSCSAGFLHLQAGSFGSQLRQIVESFGDRAGSTEAYRKTGRARGSFVMFLVDDMVFFDHCDFSPFLALMVCPAAALFILPAALPTSPSFAAPPRIPPPVPPSVAQGHSASHTFTACPFM